MAFGDDSSAVDDRRHPNRVRRETISFAEHAAASAVGIRSRRTERQLCGRGSQWMSSDFMLCSPNRSKLTEIVTDCML
jgi:hypothetical protein